MRGSSVLAVAEAVTREDVLATLKSGWTLNR